MTSSKSNYFPKSPPPNTVTMEVVGVSGWAAVLAPHTLNLGPGASLYVTLMGLSRVVTA